MNRITVNGVTIQASGSIVVSNGNIIVDGIDVTPEAKEINISVVGNVEQLKVDACSKISITGDVGSIKTTSGNVEVSGSVTNSVYSVSGSVDCGHVGGSVSTVSGRVKHTIG